jgi:hypothetical protein
MFLKREMETGTMTKIAYATISTAVLIGAGLAFAMSGPSTKDSELRRVECQALTMFTPSRGKSAEELCENYGGVALKDAAPSKEGLVILVRNQPVGGFEGKPELQ